MTPGRTQNRRRCAFGGGIGGTSGGTVTAVNSALSSQFNTTQTMSGQMTGSDSGIYPIQNLTVSIGGYQATAGIPGSGNVAIQNNNTTLNSPLIVDKFYALEQVSGEGVNSYTPSYFTIDLRGPRSARS